jgi:membrane fusion protein, multidrug efflux system
VVPTAAVQRGEPGTFVYLVKQDSTVAVQKVQLGPQDGERIAVTSGLNPGDRIVVDGADKLRDGSKVALRQESGTAPAARPAAQGKTAKPGAQGQAPQPAAPPQTAPPAAAPPPANPSQPSPPATGQ